MVPDRDDDRGPAGPGQGDAGRGRRGVGLVLGLAIVIFWVSLAFVLAYSTDLGWPSAVVVSTVLAGGQAYALRGTLFPGRGPDSTRR